ncbi:MAG: amidohydrolase family protein [Gammaproteobacteria bacterium]|nr:amidohydrolase family protein [Gammaproteobacteria bacterium]
MNGSRIGAEGVPATSSLAAAVLFWTMLLGAAPGSSAARESDSSEHASSAPAGTCRFTAGGSESERTLIIGNLLTGMDGAQYGAVLISRGRIVELVSEDGIGSAAGSAAVFDCGGNYVSPGLINPHEHTRYSFQMLTARDRAKLPVYAHRDEWIPESGVGDGEDKIRYKDGTNDAKTLFWIELRHLIAGTTLIAGSGAVQGLAKNAGSRRRPGYEYAADMRTFPFGQEAMQRIRRLPSFAYDGEEAFSPELTEDLPAHAPYVPHVAEGTDLVARLEGRFFLDYVATRNSGRRFSVIHGVGLDSGDIARLGEMDVTLIWSPRSNVALYGETADIPALLRENVQIAIGTDWSLSGSYNMLEELRCANDLHGSGSGSPALSSADLWQMATGNGAYALGLEAVTGELEAGLAADIMVFRKQSDDPFDDLLRSTAREVLATFVDGRLRSGNREGFAGALPNDCRFAVGAHFVCAELPDAAKGLPFEFGEVLQANRKEDIVPLYREDHQPFPNQVKCALRTRASLQP